MAEDAPDAPDSRGRSHGPLSGVRIVDTSCMVSGPLATTLLADQGADVVKLEAPGGGDPARHLGSSRGGASAIFNSCNRGKRSLVLDLKDERGGELLRRLVSGADVFVENFRPGVADRLGIGENALRAVRPDLVYVSIRGFGDTGPYANRRVYDVVIQALSGMAASQRNPETGHPELVRNIVCDKVTALHAAQAISAALFERERERAAGRSGGRHLRLSMLDASVAFLWPDAMEGATYLGDGVSKPADLSGILRAHPTKDGWLTVLAITDAEFAGLCRALDRPQLADDARFATISARTEHATALAHEIAAATREHATAELCARLEAEDVPAAPVNDAEDLARDPQVLASGLLVERDDARYGRVRMPRPTVWFDDEPTELGPLAPGLGEHSDAVLGELGVGPDERDALRDAGVIA